MSKKRYLYKLYRDEQYIKTINNDTITSDFKISQDLNTAGPQLELKLGATLDDSGATLDTDSLVNENGDYIVTNTDGHILLRKEYLFNDIPIDLANRIKVYASYDQEPTGIQVFDGLIMSWQANYKESNIVLNAVSYGVELDNIMLGTIPSNITEYNNSTNQETALYSAVYTENNTIQIGQTFQVTVTTEISSIKIPIRVAWDKVQPQNTSILTSINIIEGAPNNPSSVLGGAQRFIANEVQEDIIYTFNTPITLEPATTYSILLNNVYYGGFNPIYVATDSSNNYSRGTLYLNNELSGWSQIAGSDLTFKIYTSSTNNLTATYNSLDPSEILRLILRTFNYAGGRVTYDDTSIDNTSTVVSYEFHFNTVLEGVQKCLELAPGNWYWYVDPGTNLLHFHRQSQTTQHTIVNGKHVEDLQLKYTLDNMKNIVYFSGGDLGAGENLLVLNSNPASINKYGPWLEKKSDNRVTLTSTANIISRGVLAQSSNPIFETTLNIPAVAYDIETFSLGQMIGFAAFNDFVNSLQLQIVGIDRKPDLISLKLSSILPSMPHRIEDIKRNLERQETVNNPDAV
jgi:hypothetical protein